MALTTAGAAVGPADLLEQGRVAFTHADYDLSERAFLKALAAGADQGLCRSHLARIYNHRQDWLKALEQWQWLRDRQQGRFEPQLQVARALFRLQRFHEARREYQRVLDLDASQAEALKRLAYLDQIPKTAAAAPSQGEQSFDRPSLPEAGAKPPPEPSSKIEAAPRTPGARRIDRQVIAQRLVEEGRTAFQAQQYGISQNTFEEALANGADERVCRPYLARIHNLRGEWEQALGHWRWLADKTPAAVEPQLQIARALLRLDRRAEAGQAFRAVLSLQRDHPEAQRRLKELEGFAPEATDEHPSASQQAAVTPIILSADPARSSADLSRALNESSAAARPIARTILADARQAFRRQDYLHAESLFRQALQEGADEGLCRLHLARIYNHLNEWISALEQWRWLHAQDERQLESTLQVARALHRLGRSSEAVSWYRRVLAIEDGHAEASERLRQLEAASRDEVEEEPGRGSWLCTVPEPLRWQLGGDMLGGALGTLEALVEQFGRHANSLDLAADAVAEATGPVAMHRQLYGVQMSMRISELRTHLDKVRGDVRDLSRRTEKLFGRLERLTGQDVVPLRPLRQDVSPSLVRTKVEGLVAAILRERGLEAALACLYREAPVEQRAPLLSSLGIALRNTDRPAAVRLFWLAYGADPSPLAAERTAVRLFQTGDLTGAAALLQARPPMKTSGERSAFTRTMAATLALFTKGVAIPPRAPRSYAPEPRTLAYVASGSLPYQVAGYTVRTQALLESLPAVGIRPVCFTQPGFPWDRPHMIRSGQEVPSEFELRGIRYVHTRWPAGDDGPDGVEAAAQVLAAAFRQRAVQTVQAASNSRNALPALIAARRVGAKFVYEVRGLWELTAAARFPGWEDTERYRFDRELEIRTAREADQVLAITQGVADELVSGGVPRESISLLPNAVDPDLFAPRVEDEQLAMRLGLRDDDFVVMYAGSMSSYEGLDDLIDAVASLSEDRIPARLVLVGDGEFRGSLEAKATRSRRDREVIFTGRIEPGEIPRYLSLADVVAIPRKPYRVCDVVSPLKPFEAMSMAKPVVLTDLPVLREIVQDGTTGLLCAPANPPSLAAALRRLAVDPELRHRLGGAARHWVLTERSWSKNARIVADLHTALAAESE